MLRTRWNTWRSTEEMRAWRAELVDRCNATVALSQERILESREACAQSASLLQQSRAAADYVALVHAARFPQGP